jgi:glycosyltransferase involved in cell wall biosynthesis
LGGGEISLLLLLEGLIESGQVTPVLAVPAYGEVSDQAAGLGIKIAELPLPRIRYQPWRLPLAIAKAKRVIESVAPAVVHANGSRAMLIAGSAARRSGIPTVWHVRVEGLDPLDRSLSRKASAIITPSRAVATRFSGHDPVVAYNPVRIPKRVSEGVDPLEGIVRTGDESWLILVAGEISPNKGQDRILEGLLQLKTERPWRLLVAGEGIRGASDFVDQLVKKARDHGVEDRVHLLGFREDISRLMARADLLVHASRSEGFGRVYVEAMAQGLPTVVTEAGGLAELFELTAYGWQAGNGSPGELCATITEALANEDGRLRCRTEGPELAGSHFSIRTHASRIAEIYVGLLEA